MLLIASRAAVGAAVALVAACSPFDAATTDAVPADGSASAVVDGSRPDASSADAAAPAPAIDSCKSAPANAVFCEDFEIDKTHSGFTDDYGSNVFTTTRVAIAGRGQVLSYRATPTTATPNAWLRFGSDAPDSDLPSNALELSFDLAIVSQDASFGVVAAFWTSTAASVPQVHGIFSSSRGRTVGAFMAGGGSMPASVNPSEWHNVKLRLERDAGASAFKRISYVDGNVVDNTGITIDGTSWDLRFGFYYGGLGTTELLFDNVVVTRQ